MIYIEKCLFGKKGGSNMYYYKISIDTEYEGSEDMIVGHEERFTNFEFNTIVLECIDKGLIPIGRQAFLQELKNKMS